MSRRRRRLLRTKRSLLLQERTLAHRQVRANNGRRTTRTIRWHVFFAHAESEVGIAKIAAAHRTIGAIRYLSSAPGPIARSELARENGSFDPLSCRPEIATAASKLATYAVQRRCAIQWAEFMLAGPAGGRHLSPRSSRWRRWYWRKASSASLRRR